MKETLAPDKEPQYNTLELTERERKFIEFIRKLEFGSLTVEMQRGETMVISQPLKTIKL